MLGAIIGDMVGSIYDMYPIKRKDFNIYNPLMRMTDDSLLTLAVARVLMKHYPLSYSEEEIENIQNELKNAFVGTWHAHRDTVGWGAMFYNWCKENYNGRGSGPYYSFGNGAAMRISPVGWIAKSEEEVKLLSKIVTEVTHNHPEGIKGAEAIALCVYLALHGASKEEIRDRMIKEYYKEIEYLSYDYLVASYEFDPTCQGSVPEAIYCFLISDSLEDTIRNCIGIGGDSDTTGAMAGAIAEAYYNKDKLSEFEDKFLYLMIDPHIENIIKNFHKMLGSTKFDR